MSAVYSDYAVQQILLRQQDGSGTIPNGTTGYYSALFTTPPTLANTGGVELNPSTPSTFYFRLPTTLGTPASRTQSNQDTLTFTPGSLIAIANPITHLGLMTAVTGGNLWILLPLATPITVGIGSQVIFPTGQITFNFAAT